MLLVWRLLWWRSNYEYRFRAVSSRPHRFGELMVVGYQLLHVSHLLISLYVRPNTPPRLWTADGWDNWCHEELQDTHKHKNSRLVKQIIYVLMSQIKRYTYRGVNFNL